MSGPSEGTTDPDTSMGLSKAELNDPACPHIRVSECRSETKSGTSVTRDTPLVPGMQLETGKPLEPSASAASAVASVADYESDKESSEGGLSAEFSHIPEFLDVMNGGSMNIRRSENIGLHFYPDVEKLREEVVSALKEQNEPQTKPVTETEPGTQTETAVEVQMKRFIDIITAARENEKAILSTLQDTERRFDMLAREVRKDERLRRMVHLADRWRTEWRETEQVNDDLEERISKYEADMLEMKASLELMTKQLSNAMENCKEEKERYCRKYAAEKNFDLDLKLKKSEFLMKDLEKKTTDQTAKITELKKTLDNQTKKTSQCENLDYKLRLAERDKVHLTAAKKDLQAQATTCRFNLAMSKMSMKLMARELIELKEKMKAFEGNIFKLQDSLFKQDKVIQQRGEMCDLYILRAKEEANLVKTLRQNLREKDMSLYKNRDEIKQRNMLLVTKQNEIDQLKAKLRTATINENAAINTQNALDKSLGKLEMSNELNLRNIDRLNDKNSEKESALRQQHMKLLSVMEDAKLLQKSLDATVPTLKRYIAANEKFFDDNLEKLGMISKLRAKNLTQEKTIKQGEKEIANMELKVNNVRNEWEKTEDTLNLCKRANCKLKAEAFDQVEHNRILRNHLQASGAQLRSCAKDREEQQSQTQALLLSHNKMNEEIHRQINEIHHLHGEARKASVCLEIKQLEVQNLYTNLNNLEESLKRAAIQERNLTHQRDVFAARVVQAKVELQLQRMKIVELEKIIQKGNKQFNQQVSDKALLVTEIKNLRRTVKALAKIRDENDTLRDEVIKARRDLTKAELRNKAQEQIVPLKVHQLRSVKVRYPSKYEQILKIQALSKRLILKTDIVMQKEERIIELTKEMEEMRNQLNLYSSDMAFEIIDARAEVARKNKTIKSLNAEINMFNYTLSQERREGTQIRQQYVDKLERANKTNRTLRNQPRPPQSSTILPNLRRQAQSVPVQPSTGKQTNQRRPGGRLQLQGKTMVSKNISSDTGKSEKIYGEMSPLT